MMGIIATTTNGRGTATTASVENHLRPGTEVFMITITTTTAVTKIIGGGRREVIATRTIMMIEREE